MCEEKCALYNSLAHVFTVVFFIATRCVNACRLDGRNPDVVEVASCLITVSTTSH